MDSTNKRFESCSTCRFWVQQVEEEPPDSPHECRRNAPGAIICREGTSFDDDFDAYWPQTHADDWCGEWQPAKEAAKLPLPVVEAGHDR
jgi:hypothetical protein